MNPGTVVYSPAATQLPSGSSPAVRSQKLVTFNPQNESLEYWTIGPNGSSQLTPLSGSLGFNQVYNLAADGDVIVMTNYSPAEIVTYNVKTKAQTTLNDPYGGPVDVAIDKKATIYALNLASVAVFARGSSNPSELTCSMITTAEAIAVDKESDVFVDGYGHNFMGIVEYPAGSSTCKPLAINKQSGYIGGVGVDPKTDDLIVVDDPDLCAGGIEGRMRIFPKPYRRNHFRWRNLNANYCAGTIRLNADSSLIFVADATISDGYPLVDQRTYPGAKGNGVYENGYYSGSFSGFTTIPNTLPN
ncbi:MAG: hypothetical protein JO104_08075 [Candidatus Eremiobacteraeota bacterium]|nr:hypothetical protein [Candidatus Eremiobacteraeota bacterium]